MKPVFLRTVLSGFFLGVALVLTLSVSTDGATCDPSQPGNACSEQYALTRGTLGPIGGYASSAIATLNEASLPAAGALTYEDYKRIEAEARALLKEHKDFREDISPHLGKPMFDELVRQFDYNAGFSRVIPDTTVTIQQKLEKADRDLRRARNLYAVLAVYANPARFRADPDYITTVHPGFPRVLCPMPPPGDDVLTGDVDWCDFPGRMRQSVREAAYLHMIFGQQFTTDAMGLHFDAGELIGGEAFVRDEVRKLQKSVGEYDLTLDVVKEGLNLALGSGCYVSDFYTQAEWALLSRAVEGKERAQHHIAVRMSYLDDYGPTAAQGAYRDSSMAQYVDAVSTAAQNASPPSGACTAVSATRPDGDMIRKMVSDMLDTRQKAREMKEGRNVFGFDVRFTPARPYRTAVGSNDTGLWDEAWAAAHLAKTWQSDESQASRQFDQNADQLQNAILGVKQNYDARLLSLTGCSRNNFASDQAFFACVDSVAAKLSQCDVRRGQTEYNACVAQVPTGLMRQSWDALRTAYLRITRVRESLNNIPRKIDIEVGRSVAVNHAIWTNGQAQSAYEYATALVQSIGASENWGQSVGFSCGSTGCGASVSVSWGGGFSWNPFSGQIARMRRQSVQRQAQSEIQISNANSEATVRNLLLEEAELEIDLNVAAQEFNAQATSFQTLAAEASDLSIEARRARAYLQQSPANDPSYRLVRDSARLRLASQLSYASRVAYLAAKRAEYEYAARLSASNFRISGIYRARTADDIIRFLNDLKAVTDNLIVQDSEVQQEDFKLSVAQHILGLTDQNLGLTGEAARAERIRRFRAWVAQNTRTGTDGKPVLTFNFTTSIAQNGVFSNVILQGYDRFWLHKVSGIGQPKSGNTGVGMNLITEQAGNLRYRRVTMTEAGLVHLRARSGCVLEYRLIHPAALLGLEWPSGQNPESASTDFKANVNNAGGERTPAFLSRPVSATDWQVQVLSGMPEWGLAEMDLQALTDIEIIFSTTRASRMPGEPLPENCVRVDF